MTPFEQIAGRIPDHVAHRMGNVTLNGRAHAVILSPNRHQETIAGVVSVAPLGRAYGSPLRFTLTLRGIEVPPNATVGNSQMPWLHALLYALLRDLVGDRSVWVSNAPN